MKWIHLELLVLAVLAGSLTTRLLNHLNASIAFCLVSSLMVFAIVLFALEKRYGHDLDAFLQLFAKIPLVWSLTLCAGVYSYSLSMMLQLPSWGAIPFVGLVVMLCWHLTQKRFG